MLFFLFFPFMHDTKKKLISDYFLLQRELVYRVKLMICDLG